MLGFMGIMKILVLNGPNLQLLGKRKPDVYGSETLEDVLNNLSNVASELNAEIDCFQSNSEGAIVDRIGLALDDDIDGIIINPAAYTHSSIAIHDALEGVEIPTIEIHISNIHKREEFRHKSFIAPVCIGQICGLGTDGYEWALKALIRYINKLNNK